MKPGDLERRLSRLLQETTTARDRLRDLSREIEAVRAVITEIASTIRGADHPGEGGGDDAQGRAAGNPTSAAKAAQVEVVSK